ncbi:MAG: hypothetical protein P8P65_14545 [Planktotalea sp.]|jgi:hypothetical protein|uniref:hypothetical protein n=1 Tax=Planktotalea sp. TaxID=2029877 RepID=UPI0026393924|nr:hypothetical protein [Planktotalea sp.]MDG1077843.1 hypothetical protein [Planktotalea sp.]
MGFSHLQQKTGFVLLSEQESWATARYMTLVDKNGIIQVVPRPKERKASFLPFKLIAFFVVFIMLLKALALLSVGVNAYEEERLALSEGNVFEQAGAFVLWIDPATEAISSYLRPYLK